MGRKRSKSMRGIAWVKNIWRGRQLDMDLDDELRAYVAQLTDEYRARGYEPLRSAKPPWSASGMCRSVMPIITNTPAKVTFPLSSRARSMKVA